MPTILTDEEVYGAASVPHESFGAPGTTAEDRAVGIISEADIEGRTPRTSLPSSRGDKPAGFTPLTKKVTPTLLSDAELYGEQSAGTGLERAGKEAAQVVDLVAGIPAFIAKVGTRGALDIYFSAAGEAHPMEESSRIINAAMEAPWMKFMSAPIQFLTELDPSGTTMGAFTEKLGKASERVAES